MVQVTNRPVYLEDGGYLFDLHSSTPDLREGDVIIYKNLAGVATTYKIESRECHIEEVPIGSEGTPAWRPTETRYTVKRRLVSRRP